ETVWMNIVYHLMASGSKAVREVFPKALVAVHFANPENSDAYLNYASKLAYYDLDYDVFASSYYPYWHGTLENLSDTLSKIAETYDKKVMVMETSYAYTGKDSDFFANTIGEGGGFVKNYPFTVQGQANCVLDTIDTAVHMTGGIGLCYWEGTWISVGTTSFEENLAKWEEFGSGWASSYAFEYDPKDAGKWFGGTAVDNQAFFDETGHPLESLKLFALCREGNILDIRADAVKDSEIFIDLNGEIVLPDHVDAIMNDNSTKSIPVTWKNVDEVKMKSNGPVTYDILGEADGLEAHCYVSMIEYDFLQNGSFEDDKDKDAPTGWTVTDHKKADQLYVEDKLTDSLSGSKHFHFWSSASDSVDFDLTQEVTDLPEGTYKFTISIMGGDAGDHEAYLYALLDGEEIGRAPLSITGYGSWDTGTVSGIHYREGMKLEVGIHVACSGAGNGAWGKIDGAMLNSVVE
ncbi:MAG: glycosyl hydrolase 53 family protein, partial [Erysipelotrichaceae bacterium]|nr:glycosyl hydrolase 53 family protein [Erysipelotrichaceae bacterium]